MKKHKVHFFLEDKYVGDAEMKEDFRSGVFFAPHSGFCYCPECGKIWAKWLSPHPKAKFASHAVNCSEHGGGSLLQGNIFGHYDTPPHSLAYMSYELELYLRDPEAYPRRSQLYWAR